MARNDYYLGKKGSKREFKWKVFVHAHMAALSDVQKQRKSALGQEILGYGLQKLSRAFKSLKRDSPPNRSREELREDLKHYVFFAAMTLQRLPVEEPITRWDIEKIAQKLRALDEICSVKNVFNLTKDENKTLQLEVSRLNEEGKIKFTRRLWRETGLSGMR